MSEPKRPACADCKGVSRRDFLRGLGGAAVAAAGVPLFAAPRAFAAPAAAASQDTLIAQLYSTLTDTQKSAVCFGWDHKKRQMISNNWHIVPQKIGEFYTPEQRDLIMEIFKSAHSDEWVPLRLKQMKDDDPGGFANYNIAIFGKPGGGQFELVFTGRHLTMRMDGDSEPGVAFGGPVFYGHAAQGFNEKPDHPGNVYWYQALRANEVYKALDGKQQAKALVLTDVPAEAPTTLLAKPDGERAGLRVAEMSRDQQELVGKVLSDLLAPMNRKDAAEARRYIEANGGVKSLNMAYYKREDIGSDGVWDVWRLEGPAMTWYFRGSPHVHTWVWLGEKPLTTAPPGP
jgi:hypothetical protein